MPAVCDRRGAPPAGRPATRRSRCDRQARGARCARATGSLVRPPPEELARPWVIAVLGEDQLEQARVPPAEGGTGLVPDGVALRGVVEDRVSATERLESAGAAHRD